MVGRQDVMCCRTQLQSLMTTLGAEGCQQQRNKLTNLVQTSSAAVRPSHNYYYVTPCNWSIIIYR